MSGGQGNSLGGGGRAPRADRFQGACETSATLTNMAPSFLSGCFSTPFCCSFPGSSPASFSFPGLPALVLRVCHCYHSLLSSTRPVDPEPPGLVAVEEWQEPVMAVVAPRLGAVLVCDSCLGSAMGIEGLEPVDSQSGPKRISQEAGADDGVRRENQECDLQ